MLQCRPSHFCGYNEIHTWPSESVYLHSEAPVFRLGETARNLSPGGRPRDGAGPCRSHSQQPPNIYPRTCGIWNHHAPPIQTLFDGTDSKSCRQPTTTAWHSLPPYDPFHHRSCMRIRQGDYHEASSHPVWDSVWPQNQCYAEARPSRARSAGPLLRHFRASVVAVGPVLEPRQPSQPDGCPTSQHRRGYSVYLEHQAMLHDQPVVAAVAGLAWPGHSDS